MKSVQNAHVLFIPSWYHTEDNPVHGSFFRDQARAVHKSGVKTGVVFADLRTLEGTRTADWPRRRYQIVEEDDGGIPTLRSVGWRIPRAKSMTRRLWVLQTQRLIKQYVRRHGVPDLIHAHCVHQAGVAALEAKRDWRIPYVVTEHFSGYDRDLLNDDMLTQARDVFFEADRVVAVSRKLAGDIKSYAGGVDIHIIPNLVDTEFFAPPPAPRNTDPFTFLFVGFLTPNKRVDDVLRAFAAGFSSNERTRLSIVGDGDQRPALEALVAELGIGRQVDFPGILSRAEVRDRYHSANAFVSASEVETFGVVLIEAMSTGLPVIVTRCGGPEEFVTEAVGRLVEPGNRADLQQTMAEMMSDCERWRDASPSIRSDVESSFSEHVVASRLIETYNSVIQQV
jgi:glycosyltransferase involved in cell wall biosynthesis